MEIHGADDMLLSITAAGRMLMFPVADLPQLSKGKGNKIVSIPAARAAAGEDKLARLFVLPPQASVTLHVGKRKLTLRPEDLQKFRAERGRKAPSCRAACSVSIASKWMRRCGYRVATAKSKRWRQR